MGSFHSPRLRFGSPLSIALATIRNGRAPVTYAWPGIRGEFDASAIAVMTEAGRTPGPRLSTGPCGSAAEGEHADRGERPKERPPNDLSLIAPGLSPTPFLIASKRSSGPPSGLFHPNSPYQP